MGNAQCLEELANGDLEGFRSMSRDAALICAIFLGFELDIDDKMERMDMCRMFSDVKRKCIKVGKKEGRAEGEQNAFRKFVTRLLGQSRSILEICELTGASEKDVREVALSLES